MLETAVLPRVARSARDEVFSDDPGRGALPGGEVGVGKHLLCRHHIVREAGIDRDLYELHQRGDMSRMPPDKLLQPVGGS